MLWDIPVPAKARFKEACYRKNTTMKAAALRLMQAYANDWIDLDKMYKDAEGHRDVRRN
jgi:hypothetical protein